MAEEKASGNNLDELDAALAAVHSSGIRFLNAVRKGALLHGDKKAVKELDKHISNAENGLNKLKGIKENKRRLK